MFDAADYTILLPFPTESLTAQERSDEPSLQAGLRSLVVGRLLSVKFRCFSCSYGSTGQFADVAKLSVGNGQTFGSPALLVQPAGLIYSHESTVLQEEMIL